MIDKRSEIFSKIDGIHTNETYAIPNSLLMTGILFKCSNNKAKHPLS